MPADKVWETTTTTGTGAKTLGGAVSGYDTFLSGFGASAVNIDYEVNMGLLWEVGIASLSSDGLTLTSTLISRNSSGTTAAINFPVGTKQIFSPLTAHRLRLIASQNSEIGAL